MKCEYCDNEVPMGVTRCPSCGAMISQSPTMFVPTQSSTMQSNAATSVSDVPVLHSSSNPTTLIDLKSRWTFVLLGVFLGGFGIHNFYLGYIGRGVAKLLITLLSVGWFYWISWIWGIVEICTVRIDARGFPLES